jgi:hypothetical protein
VSLHIERTIELGAHIHTTTIPLTFLKIKSSERQQSRKGCESLMGWVGGVNARVCDVIANRTSTRLAYRYIAALLRVVLSMRLLCAALWQFAANYNNSNPTKMLVEEPTRASHDLCILCSAKIRMRVAKLARIFAALRDFDRGLVLS